MEQLNYCIGRYWNGKDGSVSVYAFHTQIQHGTLEDALEFKKYVESASIDKEWKIFVLKELENYNEDEATQSKNMV